MIIGIYQDLSGRGAATPQIHVTGTVLPLPNIPLHPQLHITAGRIHNVTHGVCLQATAEANNLAAVAAAKDLYNRKMEVVSVKSAS